MPHPALRTAFLALAAALASAGCGLAMTGELVVTDDAGVDSTHPHPSSGGSSGGLGTDGDDSGARPGDDSGDPGNDPGDDGGGMVGRGDDGGPTTGTRDGGHQCNYAGRWATKITVPVNWVPQGLMSVIIAPGSGVIQQWIMSDRVVNGPATVDTAVVCGITLPDFSGTDFVGGEHYGIRFPDSLFDNPYIPKFAIPGTLGDSSPGATFKTSPTAVLIGLTMVSPSTAPWPATISTAVDTDKDMEPGVTTRAASGPTPDSSGVYSTVPVDVYKTRADSVYVVIRQVTALSGAASDCDHISGTVTIPKISTGPGTNKYAIDSHVVGCGLADGSGDCTAGQTAFVDGTQPVFSPTAGTTFATVRVAATTTCAQVRQALP